MSIKGQPAFENIDELLAEKIISHTDDNADKNKKIAFETTGCKNEPCTGIPGKVYNLKKILFFLLFSGILLYLFTPRQKKRDK